MHVYFNLRYRTTRALIFPRRRSVAIKKRFLRGVWFTTIKKTAMETGDASFAGDLLRCTIAFRYLYIVRLTISQHSLAVRYHGCTLQSEHYAPAQIVREEKLGNPLG